jgi:hypothetical protein
LQSNQFDRTRPARPKDKPFDPLAAARTEGPSIVQSFHESASQRGGKLTAILGDICAFANTAGGAIYIGAGPRKEKIKGLDNPKQVEEEILTALADRLTPPLEIKSDTLQSEGVQVLRLRVPKGADRPYCLDDSKFYVRDQAETSLAVRDEIVALVREALVETGKLAQPGVGGATPEKQSGHPRDRSQRRDRRPGPAIDQGNGKHPEPEPALDSAPLIPENGASMEDAFYLPQVGVEIVNAVERNGHRFYSIRDLRNGHVIHNVTRKGARMLWNYAIHQYEDNQAALAKAEWKGDIGMIKVEKRAGKVRYDLARREGERIRLFYGVTDEGMEGEWAEFVQEE